MEVCSLRDAAEIMDELGVEVFGISLDDVVTQAKFVKDQELNFPLLSDPDGSVARRYGVLAAGARFPSRITFVIDDEGVVRDVNDKVNVQSHGMDLAELVVQLQE